MAGTARKTNRVKRLLAVDLRRMFTTRFLYIMMGICLVMPILILVMTTMMDGSVTVDPQTGAETVIEGFKNTWQTIGSLPGEGSVMDMSLTSMCNINMLYFFVVILVGVFVAEDFRSGYAKNIFTVRAQKGNYVISKTVVCFIGSVLMFLAYFVGSILGGSIAGLPFDTTGFGIGGVVMSMLSKLFMVAVFVGISLLISVAAKSKTWLSIVGGLMASMLLYTMVPMITPLDSGIMNVILCLAGGILFSIGLGAVSKIVLNKTSLV